MDLDTLERSFDTVKHALKLERQMALRATKARPELRAAALAYWGAKDMRLCVQYDTERIGILRTITEPRKTGYEHRAVYEEALDILRARMARNEEALKLHFEEIERAEASLEGAPPAIKVSAMLRAMQAGWVDFLEDEVLDHVVGDGAYTSPTAHVWLSTTTPTESGGNVTEPSGNGYARKTTAAADWSASSGGAKTNSNALAFPQASGSWGTVTHFGLNDASTSGNHLMWAALGTSKTVGSGDTPSFAAGELDLTLD